MNPPSRPLLAFATLAVVFAPAVSTTAADSTEQMIAALGRIEPEGGVVRISGPSAGATVIAELLVEEGDMVAKNQRIAVLDSYPLRMAQVDRLQAELENAELVHGLTNLQVEVAIER